MINKLKLEDINQKYVDDIAFVYISHPGSLGPDGKVEFILNNNDSYSCNIAYKQEDDYIDYLTLKERLTKFDMNFDISSGIKKYENIYLGGCGNNLYIKPKYALIFYRFAYGLSPPQVFQKWREFVDCILYDETNA